MTHMMKQSDAVVQAVLNIVGPKEGAYTKADLDAHKTELRAVLFEGFMGGKIALKDESQRNADYIKGYIPGLITNHLNKDKRLNGGVKYTPANPGSKAGTGDEQVRALRLLIKNGIASTHEEIVEIETAINYRLAEIAKSKAREVVVNYDALPANIAAKYNQQ